MITWTLWDSVYEVIDFFQRFPDSKTALNEWQNDRMTALNDKIDVREIMNYCQV